MRDEKSRVQIVQKKLRWSDFRSKLKVPPSLHWMCEDCRLMRASAERSWRFLPFHPVVPCVSLIWSQMDCEVEEGESELLKFLQSMSYCTDKPWLVGGLKIVVFSNCVSTLYWRMFSPSWWLHELIAKSWKASTSSSRNRYCMSLARFLTHWNMSMLNDRMDIG